MPASPKVYLRSYPVTDGMEAHAYAVEEDGWDGMLFTPTQILSMEVFGSLYLAASATSRLELGTAVTNLVTRHPAVMASAFASRLGELFFCWRTESVQLSWRFRRDMDFCLPL